MRRVLSQMEEERERSTRAEADAKRRRREDLEAQGVAVDDVAPVEAKVR